MGFRPGIVMETLNTDFSARWSVDLPTHQNFPTVLTIVPWGAQKTQATNIFKACTTLPGDVVKVKEMGEDQSEAPLEQAKEALCDLSTRSSWVSYQVTRYFLTERISAFILGALMGFSSRTCVCLDLSLCT